MNNPELTAFNSFEPKPLQPALVLHNKRLIHVLFWKVKNGVFIFTPDGISEIKATKWIERRLQD